MAYKGSGKKARKQSGMQIGGPSPNLSNFGAPKKSKKQDSNKVHNTKGRNTHGRSSGYGRSR